MAAGLPFEGRNAEAPLAGTLARRDAPTSRPDASVAAARDRTRAGGWDVCVVVNEAGVVMGLLRQEELGGEGDELVERVMRLGPSTFRPHVSALEMAEHMLEHDLPTAPITTSDGVLVGVLRRDDAIRAAKEWHDRAHGSAHGEDATREGGDDAGE